MSIEQNAEYYNKTYRETESYRVRYTESPYYQLWKEVIKLIPESAHIAELGCGTGQFADMLYDSDRGIKNYVGYDFSAEAISIAMSGGLVTKGNYYFYNTDLLSKSWGGSGGFIVALEVLEHLQDYELIKKLGLGREILFTVPDFDDPAHVRYFHDVNSVVNRYMHVIKFEHVQKFQRWYICKGVTI